MRRVLSLPHVPDGWLSLAPVSTSLSVADDRVSSWDLSGRPYALVRPEGTYRRALDGHLLLTRRRHGAREYRRLPAAQGGAVCEAARAEAIALRGSLEARPERALGLEAARRLDAIAAMDTAALERDAGRFREVYRPIGILPPDQYLALVVQVTEGCSWNACTFCDLYAQTPFRVKTPEEMERHLRDVKEFFGAGLCLRRSAFLGDANALCLAHERLLPLIEVVRQGLGHTAPLHAFVDAWTGRRKAVSELREYGRLGLRRVYVGLETGDPALLAWLRKPGSPDDAVALVRSLHEADLAVGVIVLLGAGGARFAVDHVRRTAAVLGRMELSRGDILYFSELVVHPTRAYARRAQEPDLAPLSTAACAAQAQAIREALPARGRGPRIARYDIREFVY